MSKTITIPGVGELLSVTDRDEYEALLKSGVNRGTMLTPTETEALEKANTSKAENAKIAMTKLLFGGYVKEARTETPPAQRIDPMFRPKPSIMEDPGRYMGKKRGKR